MANGTNIPLQDVTYQYWFNGPDGVTAFDTSSPMDLFELQCSDATTGQSGWECSLVVYLSGCKGAALLLGGNARSALDCESSAAACARSAATLCSVRMRMTN